MKVVAAYLLAGLLAVAAVGLVLLAIFSPLSRETELELNAMVHLSWRLDRPPRPGDADTAEAVRKYVERRKKHEAQDLVIKGKNGNELKEQAIKDGYVPMRDYGWHKVMKGMTTVEEVVSATAVDLASE